MGYHIELTENPSEYRDEIIRFWKEYLPDTPPSRYEWLTTGSPAGKAKWFLALDSQSKSLLGFITVLPRHFIVKGRQVQFGIMGDFVVEKQYRGFGPGMQLPRRVLDKAGELGFSLIYTIPYYKTLRHIERAGFKHRVTLRWFIKPLVFHRYMRNAVAARMANISALLFDNACCSLLVNAIVLRNKCFVDTTEMGAVFDRFWVRLKNRDQGILGSRDSRYLTWRYGQNPLMKFRVLTLSRKASEEIQGYVIYTINGSKLDIYDIQYTDKKTRKLLILKLIWIARRRNCEAAYLLTSAGNKALSGLRVFGLICREEEHPLCYASLEPEMNLDNWRFLQGDRNV